MATTTDRDVRRKALVDTGISITTRAKYMEAVRAANQAFKAQCSKLWMQYVRDDSFKPIGLVLLFNTGSLSCITGSICDPKDTWNKDLAFFYAAHRLFPSILDMESKTADISNLPRKCQGVANAIVSRFTSRTE